MGQTSPVLLLFLSCVEENEIALTCAHQNRGVTYLFETVDLLICLKAPQYIQLGDPALFANLKESKFNTVDRLMIVGQNLTLPQFHQSGQSPAGIDLKPTKGGEYGDIMLKGLGPAIGTNFPDVEVTDVVDGYDFALLFEEVHDHY